MGCGTRTGSIATVASFDGHCSMAREHRAVKVLWRPADLAERADVAGLVGIG